MGCNCGRNRKAAQQRRGFDRTLARPSTATDSASSGSTSTQQGTDAPAKGQTQEFSVRFRDGSTQSFGSRLEADAANARAGYSGTVKRG